MELVYVYDAYCGWCFGFSKVMAAVQQQQPELPITVISGGLVLGDRIGPVGAMAGYIKGVIPRLQDMTGVQFGQAYLHKLDDPTHIQDSNMPAIALALARQQDATQQLAFAHALLQANFVHGQALSEPDTYGPLAAAMGWDAESFTTALHDPAQRALAQDDFQFAQAIGATGFPALYARHGQQYYQLTAGYASLDHVLEGIAWARAQVVA